MKLFKNELRPFMSVCVCWGGGGGGDGDKVVNFFYLPFYI